MIEGILEEPLALIRHETTPLLKEREEFLSHLLRQGTSHLRVRSIAGYLIQVVRLMELTSLRNVRLEEITRKPARFGQTIGGPIAEESQERRLPVPAAASVGSGPIKTRPFLLDFSFCTPSLKCKIMGMNYGFFDDEGFRRWRQGLMDDERRVRQFRQRRLTGEIQRRSRRTPRSTRFVKKNGGEDIRSYFKDRAFTADKSSSAFSI
jgi:hypothetical protein